MTTLCELRLAHNNLVGTLPASLGNLSRLEVLELQDNKITDLPDEIEQLVHLRILNISGNQVEAIPSGFFAQVPLIDLYASKNALKRSLFKLDTISHLQTLSLSGNALVSLGDSESISLPALKTLDVSNNRLANLPNIESWTHLATMLVGDNKLKAIPDGFTALQNLRSADFTANDIREVDSSIALMDGLESLCLAANPLREKKFLTMGTDDIKRDLHSRLDRQDADVSGRAMDEDVEASHTQNHHGWKLKFGGTLDLSSQNCSELDEEHVLSFAQDHDVRQLLLGQNTLTLLPPVLSQLANLTLLDLSKNAVAQPLSDAVQLPRLRELRLAGNKLTSFDALLAYLSAPALSKLDVSNNRITGALPALRDMFPDLTLLLASDNAISDVSAEALDGLRTVSLSNNDIARLEPRIGLLAGCLASLDVDGNTFRVPNYAVLQKGTDAVLAWLRDKIPDLH